MSGLKLNRDKCQFNKTKLEFLGHIISDGGIYPSPDKVSAIKNLKAPEITKDLRRVMDLFNFVTKFVPNAQLNMYPLNSLLKKGSSWEWGETQQNGFDKIKQSLSSTPALAYFEQNKEIVVAADSSSYAMGGVLLQRHDGVLRPVAYCSRSLSRSEQNYAQIEKELLTSVWVCEKFRIYIQGCQFVLQTDHKPLIPLINTKSLADTPVRCQRLLMRLARFSPKAQYVPGKYMVVADALSRDVANTIMPERTDLSKEIHDYEISSIQSLPVSENKLIHFITEQNTDKIIKDVKQFIVDGWPDDIDSDLLNYFQVRGELSTINDLLLFRDRIVVPNSMRIDILNRIHDGHMSVNKCRARANNSVWWPFISRDISNFVERCNFCQINRKNKIANR